MAPVLLHRNYKSTKKVKKNAAKTDCLHWQNVPVYPVLHLHRKMSETSKQVPPFRHGFGLHGPTKMCKKYSIYW